MRSVSALAAPAVPSYLALDMRRAWLPRADVEVSIAAQNLLGPAHGEFTAEATRTFSPAVPLELVSRF